ncbi:AsmA family protein [Chitinivorax sp. PXF-14]|uniref:AsmA family protein n=1 Tax=Chitinivorax sp. PXF-14 TaxID=3230488 RepID=UPI003466B996
MRLGLYTGGLAVAGWLVMPIVTDLSRYERELASRVEQATQRKFSLQGPLRLSLWPLGIELNKVALSERLSDDDFLGAERAVLGLRLLPLLHGELSVDRLTLEGLRVNLRRLPDGSHNFDDLLQSPKPGPLTWSLRQLQVRQGQLRWYDRESQPRWVLREVGIEGARNDRTEPLRLDLAGELLHPGFSGHIEAKAAVKVDPRLREFSLPDLQAKWVGTAEGTRIGVALSGGLQYAGGVATLSRGGVRFDAYAGALHFSAAGAMPTARWEEGRFTAPKLKMRGSLEAQADRGKLDIEFSQLSAQSGSLAAESALHFEARHGNHALAAELAGPIRVGTGFNSFSLPKAMIKATLSRDGESKPLSSLQVNGSASLDWAEQQVFANLSGSYDDAPASLRFVMRDFGAPRYDLNAELTRLDVNRLVLAKPAPAKPGEDSRGPVQLDFSLLDGWAGKAELKIGELLLGPVHFGQVLLGARSEDGMLQIEPFAASLYQGTLSGSASLAFRARPELKLKQRLVGMNVRPLLEDVIGLSRVEGRGEAEIELTASGDSVDEMRRSLDGNVRVSLRDGSIRGIDLGKLLVKPQSKSGEHAADVATSTAFSSLNAVFQLKKGVARTDELRLDSPLLSLGGGGLIDVAENVIDYKLEAAFTKKPGGHERAALAGVVVPVTISGPLNAPHYDVDMRPLIERLAAGTKKAAGGAKP